MMRRSISIVQAFTLVRKFPGFQPVTLSQRAHHDAATKITFLMQNNGINHGFKNARISHSKRLQMFDTIDDNSIDVDSSENSIDVDDDSSNIAGDWYEAGDDDTGDAEETEEESEEITSEEVDELTDLYEIIRASVDKAVNAKTKKVNVLQKELDKSKALEATMKRANLIISNLYQLPRGATSAVVQDWDMDGEDVELVLSDEYDTAQEESDALFASARKMKRGSAVVGALIAETNEALEVLQDTILDLDAALEESGGLDEGRLHLLLDRLERTSSRTGFVMEERKSESPSTSKGKANRGIQSTKPQNTFRKFLSPGGCKVLVGRNKRDNEAICFQEAKGDDIWMHARGCPGAHVLLHIRRGSPRPTDECMQFAANLAAFYSDARTERKAPVTTASPKHIQKPRGAPLGAVKVREELNTLTGFPADVDDELKIAREESGVIWDESGSRSLGGKAKNKKKTRENTKQLISKKRAEKKEKRKRKQNGPDELDMW